jgi:hypothetical protein
MKRVLLILTIAAAGLVAACSQGTTSSSAPSNALESVPAVSAEAPSMGASEPASMAPDQSAAPSQ